VLQVLIVRRNEYRCYVDGKVVTTRYTELDATAWLSSTLHKKESKITKASCITGAMVKQYRKQYRKQLDNYEATDLNPSNWLRPPK
jgi:hypothetical protein